VRYLGVDDDRELIQAWIDGLDARPERSPRPRGELLHFRDLGPIAHTASGEVDVKASPLVSWFEPRLVRGILWTAGEVHFLATPLHDRFPGLDRVRRQLVRWLSQFEVVFDAKGRAVGDQGYFLEGSIQNDHLPLYALPRAYAALQRGSYFVSDDDNDEAIDRICRKLALRGVTCADPPAHGATSESG